MALSRIDPFWEHCRIAIHGGVLYQGVIHRQTRSKTQTNTYVESWFEAIVRFITLDSLHSHL